MGEKHWAAEFFGRKDNNMSRLLFSRRDQVRILTTPDFCPRCRQVAGEEFLRSRRDGESDNPGAAVQAYKMADIKGVQPHTFVQGRCHADRKWPF